MDAAAVNTPSAPAGLAARPIAAPAPPSPSEPALAAGQMALIYDGRCTFCIAQSKRLARLARPGSIALLDAHAPGVLDHFGGAVTMDRAMAAVQLLAPQPSPAQAWRKFEGCEAVVRALATRSSLALLVHIYYLPPVRHACDAAYRAVARNRYRISRLWPAAAVPGGVACEGDACRLPPRA